MYNEQCTCTMYMYMYHVHVPCSVLHTHVHVHVHCVQLQTFYNCTRVHYIIHVSNGMYHNVKRIRAYMYMYSEILTWCLYSHTCICMITHHMVLVMYYMYKRSCPLSILCALWTIYMYMYCRYVHSIKTDTITNIHTLFYPWVSVQSWMYFVC